MSAIFGLIESDGRPVGESLAAMEAALHHWGPDGGDGWQEGGVGLGQRQLAVTLEAAWERQPLVDSDQVWISAARLDNRAELCRELGIRELTDCPDSHLMQQAWRRWGEECLSHFCGDWALAVWDKRSRKLFLARDHGGNTSLYYHHSAQRFAFASGLGGLFALPEIPRRPDPLKAAQMLVAWVTHEPEATIHQGIKKLLPGHFLRLDGGRLTIHRYWRPEELPELKLADDAAYEEAFLEVYNRAVASCLRSSRPVVATLSGGLDSGSVCALAARQLAERGERLHAYTALPQYLPTGEGTIRRGDEWELAQATATFSGHIDLTPIRSENVSLLESLERILAITHNPQHAASNFHWILAILDAAQAEGAGVLLTGQNGNATVSYGGDGLLLPYLKRGDWQGFRQAGREMIAHNPWQAVKSQLLRPVAQPLRQRWREGRSSLKGLPPWGGYSAIHPGFARELRLRDMMRVDDHDPTFTRPSPALLSRFRTVGLGAGEVWHAIGAAYQIEVRDPTLDRRVIEFCCRVPDRQYCRGDESRWLLRRALRPFMPAAVLDDKRKGLQAADVGHRIAAQQSELAALLDRLERHPLVGAWLDLTRMRGILASLGREVAAVNTGQARMILLRGLSMGLYLEHYA